jgi:NADH:ubiquinone oxidoreductase subunit 3 (subunit A)
MKLNLIFIVMDVLTVLAYPIVYVYGKLRLFAKTKESITPANELITSSIAPVR